MKTRSFVTALLLVSIMVTFSSCSVWNKVFGPKYGCPANGRDFGAERVLSGEKVPKAGKFKS